MDFLVTFDEDGNLVFANGSMKRNWGRVKDFYQRSGTYFNIFISDPQKNSTEAQHKLFLRMCMTMAEDTGMEFHEVQKELLRLTPTKKVESLFGSIPQRHLELGELDTVQFREFLEKVLVVVNEFTGSNYILYHDDNIGTVFTKKNP